MYLAGTPPTTVFLATSFVTTAPAAIIAPSPIVTPGTIVTLEPTQTSLPMTMGDGIILPLLKSAAGIDENIFSNVNVFSKIRCEWWKNPEIITDFLIY